MVNKTQTVEEMELLFEMCYMKNPDKYMSKKEIQEIVENKGILSYLDYSLQSDKIRFALLIDKFIGKMLLDIYMKVDNADQRACRRKYKFTKSLQLLPI